MLERRNDIGNKVGGTILFSLIAFLLGILFQQSHGIAVAALAKAGEVELKGVKMEECIRSISANIGELKGDMKSVLGYIARDQGPIKVR